MHWVILGATALLIGLAKTGLTNISLIALPVVASLFGGRESSGIILSMLIIGDVFGVRYYHSHAKGQTLKKILPWAVVGVAIGTIVGGYLSDTLFQLIMALFIITSVTIIFIQELKKTPINPPNWPGVPIFLGILGGFATMHSTSIAYPDGSKPGRSVL